MSEKPIEPKGGTSKRPFYVVAPKIRYSIRQMMEEVEAERKYSVIGRELVDKVEIKKIFAKRKRKGRQ